MIRIFIDQPWNFRARNIGVMPEAWSSPAVHWREIKDFAYIYDFNLSEKVQAIANAARDAEIPAQPAEPVIPEERDKLAEILQSSSEVLADLIG